MVKYLVNISHHSFIYLFLSKDKEDLCFKYCGVVLSWSVYWRKKEDDSTRSSSTGFYQSKGIEMPFALDQRQREPFYWMDLSGIYKRYGFFYRCYVGLYMWYDVSWLGILPLLNQLTSFVQTVHKIFYRPRVSFSLVSFKHHSVRRTVGSIDSWNNKGNLYSSCVSVQNK